jgi:hypothetical protein
MIRSFLIAVAAAAISAVPAHSTTAFDGAWNITIITQRGDCEASYQFQVDVRNGIVSHPNIVRLTGRVKANGAAYVSVAVLGKSAAGSGRLTRSSGRGRWSGRSETSKCSGVWRAQRY